MQKIKLNKYKLSVAGLILVSVLWGYGFVAVDKSMDAGMHPTLIMSMRFLIASVFITIVFFKRIKGIQKRELIIGSIAGVFLFFGFYLQTVGQKMSTASKSAFLSSTNVIIVPFIVWILQKKRPKIKTFVLSVITLLGAAVISIGDIGVERMETGDIILLLGAVFFACHLSFLGVYGRGDLDAIRVTFIQMLSAGIISVTIFLLFNLDTVKDVDFKAGTPSMMYVGIVSTSICYMIHMATQKYVKPTQTSLILSTESIFGSFFSILLGYEKATLSLILGGSLIFISVILNSINLDEIWKKIKNR